MRDNDYHGGKRMTQNTELIELVFRKLKTPRDQTKQIINCFIETLVESLEAGEDVEIERFGRFLLVDVPERETYLYGKTRYVIPAHKRVQYKPAPTLRKRIREAHDEK